MGQKTNPIGNRLGIIRGWDSNWYGGKDYGDKLAEDEKIRKYIFVRLNKASVSNVIIERTLKIITVTITTARPGIIIGKAGQEVDKLKEELTPGFTRFSCECEGSCPQPPPPPPACAPPPSPSLPPDEYVEVP